MNNLKKKKILAIIPARAGSRGLKNKNIRLINNRPLIYWPIFAARKSKYINKVILSSDSTSIAKTAKKFKAETPFIRPKKLAKDDSKSVDVIIHAINFFKKNKIFFDYVVLLEPTSPLTTSKDIDKALEILHKKRKYADSIVSVAENVNKHPSFSVKINKDKIIKPYLKKFMTIRRQKILKIYFFDGSLYISKINTLLEKKTFNHHKTLAYIVDKWKSIEIDDIIDLISAEAIMKNINRIKK